jgi:hypothetical protein
VSEQHTFTRTGRFNAKYEGWCMAPDCLGTEKRARIEIGDVCEYVDDELMHLTCAGRVIRGETKSFCSECWLYH